LALSLSPVAPLFSFEWITTRLGGRAKLLLLASDILSILIEGEREKKNKSKVPFGTAKRSFRFLVKKRKRVEELNWNS